MTIGEKIKNLRKEKGMTQNELSSGIVTRNMLSLIENNSAKPSLGTTRAFAERLGVPVEYLISESDSVASFSKMDTIRIVRRSLNPKLELEGVLLTMFDGRTNLALQVAEEVKHYFPGKVFSTVIPRNVRLSEAPSHGKPISYYDRTSRGAAAYAALAAEFLKKQA